MRLPVMPPVEPMLAKLVRELPAGKFYEPKWDGFRAIVFRDGDEVVIGSRNGRPLARYFPELVDAALLNLPRRCVVDGEIVAESFWALQQRLHPAASRVQRLAGETPAVFYAFDLLALGETDYTPQPFHERRAALEGALGGAAPPIHLTPITRDERQARAWFDELAGTDGLIAKDGEQPYRPGERVMRKFKHHKTADCVVAGYRVHASDPQLVGSLLLGLYDDGSAPVRWADAFGGLVPIGVVGSFPMARRRELLAELAPLVVDAADHPWARAEPETVGGPGSRWSPGKSLSFIPLRPERVLEIRYGQVDGGRLRYPAQFVRWRPDRDPSSCSTAQLAR
ncbi:MAG TPA: ATP-dependent DNA ligase [Solirubrobacteraceae bacterium]|nr:ATP-dependent DNA ligase [Solirubrobacteraceae bacterium]